MCPSGMTCLSADYCFSELALYKSNSAFYCRCFGLLYFRFVCLCLSVLLLGLDHSLNLSFPNYREFLHSLLVHSQQEDMFPDLGYCFSSSGNWIVCPLSINGFWVPLWYLQTFIFVKSTTSNTIISLYKTYRSTRTHYPDSEPTSLCSFSLMLHA
jgi:hypothetical protein